MLGAANKVISVTKLFLEKLVHYGRGSHVKKKYHIGGKTVIRMMRGTLVKKQKNTPLTVQEQGKVNIKIFL